MDHLLHDLLRHQRWADAELWKAIEICPQSATDAELRKRLYHTHVTQFAFYSIVLEQEPRFPKADDFPDLGTLKSFAMRVDDTLRNLMRNIQNDQLSRSVMIPWFKDPPLALECADALTQAAMHSQYHRGQNAARLRQIGGSPPLTDFIMWIWKGRPEPLWA